MRVLRVLGRVALRLVPVLGIVVAVASWVRMPVMSIEPAMAGLACWTVGNYLICPLRWRSVSSRGQKLSWYTRIFAEGELLGMLTPQHAGADLWRIRQLVAAGSDKRSAVVEVAADRLSGSIMIIALAVLAGFSLPSRFLPLAGLGLATVAGVSYLTRSWWRPKLADIERPSGLAFARSAAISALYQAGYLGFVIGLVAAVGHHVDPLGTASVVGISQAAGLLPGVHGAGPREGAMAGGLVALGLPVTAALSAVALGVALAWLPALAVGGSGLAIRGVARRRAQRNFSRARAQHSA
jgi:hypothetical protein